MARAREVSMLRKQLRRSDRNQRLNSRYPLMHGDMRKLKRALKRLAKERPDLDKCIIVFKLFYGVDCKPHTLKEIQDKVGLRGHSSVAERRKEIDGRLQRLSYWT
jgi:hypothetical protein